MKKISNKTGKISDSAIPMQHCATGVALRSRFGAHLRPPPLWPRDGGGPPRRQPGQDGQDAVRWRGRPGRSIAPLLHAPLAALLLLGHVLHAGAAPGATPAPAMVSGLLPGPAAATSPVTVPPLPPLPPLPALPAASFRAATGTSSQVSSHGEVLDDDWSADSSGPLPLAGRAWPWAMPSSPRSWRHPDMAKG